ncbi:hypothetical protein N0V87_008729 [Didymella glomerata]|uniref:Uncharacterized protein n=1 Tax=Didymella glomerata TaxID=749621 RepID=A0A9W8WSG7_9PLEO|nr:hypothetical protein N0V87_008729 [Didymella glomerata]
MPFSLRNSFARIYPGGEAWGTTFNDMCDIITESGFDPATHAVLSYATTLDMQILWKILNGLNTPFVIYTAKDNFGLHRKQRSCFQPVNILWLVKQMLDCPDYKLKTVYRKLFGLEDSRLHRADIDTVIFLDVVRMLATFE